MVDLVMLLGSVFNDSTFKLQVELENVAVWKLWSVVS